MNLAIRHQYKTTATAQFISVTQAIFSDEVSTSIDCLSIVKAKSEIELKRKIIQLAINAAQNTRFSPRINIIKDGMHKVYDVATNSIKQIAPEPNSKIEPPKEPSF